MIVENSGLDSAAQVRALTVVCDYHTGSSFHVADYYNQVVEVAQKAVFNANYVFIVFL